MATRIILDTDIGTDVDDCLALALILGSPELALAGITCVYGDVDLRARMTLKLLRLRGVEGVPVFAGARHPSWASARSTGPGTGRDCWRRATRR